MFSFQPARTSSPHKSQTQSFDVSLASAISAPELLGLSAQDIELLDAVIERAGPSTNTFITIFKAYNDVLQERGLDPHEVVYYGKLLKIGTLRGANWGDKWRAVKQQQGYGTSSLQSSKRASDPQRKLALPPVPTSPTLGRRTAIPPRSTVKTPTAQDDDTVKVHPRRTNADPVNRTRELRSAHPAQRFTRPSVRPSSPTLSITPSIAYDNEPLSVYSLLSTPKPRRIIPPSAYRVWEANGSEGTEDNGAPSSTPPSYRTTVRDVPTIPSPPKPVRSLPSVGVATPTAAREVIARARERRGSVVNEDEAWKKIRMSRDEQDADRFYRERLVERSWESWKAGFEWFRTTNEQVGEAYDSLILRRVLQCWRTKATLRLQQFDQATRVSDKKRLKASLAVWKSRFKTRKQNQWRREMRSKMNTVRSKRDAAIAKDAWLLWRQAYLSSSATKHFSERLVIKSFHRWKENLEVVRRMESVAKELELALTERSAERCWHHWKRQLAIRNAERVVSTKVNRRIVAKVVTGWRQRLLCSQTAVAFYDLSLLKSTVRSWKAARDRMKALESKADKHLARQDDLLLRAVTRVWRAHERGRLLERVIAVRIVKSTWNAWSKRIQQRKSLEDTALAFSLRAGSVFATQALEKWRQAYATHLNAYQFAVQFHQTQLKYKMLLAWRLKCRKNVKFAKQANLAEKFFILRKSIIRWKGGLAQKRREKMVRELEIHKMGKIFKAWAQRTRQSRQRKLLAEVIRNRVDTRVMRTALYRWTNKVIELKLRELEVIQRRQSAAVTSAFRKWKAVCIRHVEELNLMESYQLVKREESTRRTFHRWLSAARAARHRRLTLQAKEDEMKRVTIVNAWDKWRERFIAEKLRHIERKVILQSQRNLAFRAFGVWHAKTTTLPAIRFHASHTKAKVWSRWRNAMPKAMQAKEAREFYKNSVQAAFFSRWVEAYKTKIALKAVARARYLRLPTSTPRQPVVTSRPLGSTRPFSTRAIFPRVGDRTQSPETDADTELEVAQIAKPKSPASYGTRTGISSLLTSKLPPKPHTRATSPSRSVISEDSSRASSPPPRKYLSRSPLSLPPSASRSVPSASVRAVSPTRTRPSRPPTLVGGEQGRSSLWLELREMQKRSSRPPTERSKSPVRM